MTTNHRRHSDKGAKERSDKNSERNRPPPEKSTDHGKEFDISTAHPFTSGQQLIAECNGKKDSATNERTNKGSPQRESRERRKQGKQQSGNNTGQANDIRNDLIIEINKGNHHQCRREGKIP